MMLATGIALLFTSAISVFTPAMNALIYVDVTPAGIAKMSSQIHTYLPTLEALRAGTMQTLRLNHVEGLVSFPSFHTTAGLLFIWTLWTVPPLRWPVLILNVMLIASTPIAGEHYFIDIFGGGLVALASILIAERLSRRAVWAGQTAIEASPSRA